MKAVDEFLINTKPKRWFGGGLCNTCQLVNIKTINKVSEYFLKQRLSGKTNMPWRVFVADFLKPKYGYNLNYRSLKKHMKECLGFKEI